MLPSVVVQLGRIGDIINVLPPCRLLGLRHMLVHADFRCALGGQSYVEPIIWPGAIDDVSGAVAYARTLTKDVRVPQLFGSQEGLSPRSRTSFVMDQWDRLQPGLGDKWGTLPLEFDKRDSDREAALVRRRLGPNGGCAPVVLVNLASSSSPFEHFGPGLAPRVMEHMQKRCWDGSRFVVDISGLRENPYCNLVALYERAAGLVTVDTASLHLARAAPTMRVFQFVRPDRDASPVVDASQPYSYAAFDKLDAFVEELR